MLVISLGLPIKFQSHQWLQVWRKSVVVLTTDMKNCSSKAPDAWIWTQGRHPASTWVCSMLAQQMGCRESLTGEHLSCVFAELVLSTNSWLCFLTNISVLNAKLHIHAENSTSRKACFLVPLCSEIHSREQYPYTDILKHRDLLFEWAKKGPVSDMSLSC